MNTFKHQTDKDDINKVNRDNNLEEFIEDKFPVYIRYNMILDCDVIQTDGKEKSLRQMIKNREALWVDAKLIFKISEIDVPDPYDIYWKVLNRGERAKELDMQRGQIVKGAITKVEFSDFVGDHIVECYAVKNGVVVARDSINVTVKK